MNVVNVLALEHQAKTLLRQIEKYLAERVDNGRRGPVVVIGIV